MPRDILGSLDAARMSGIDYLGGGNGIVRASSMQLAQKLYYASGWESIDAISFRLPEGVYDKRETLQYMARERGLIDAKGTINRSYSVRFSISVRDLCERGILIWQAPDLPNHVHRRFVRLPNPKSPDLDQPLPSRALALHMRRLEFAQESADVARLAQELVTAVTAHILQSPDLGVDDARRALDLVLGELATS